MEPLFVYGATFGPITTNRNLQHLYYDNYNGSHFCSVSLSSNSRVHSSNNCISSCSYFDKRETILSADTVVSRFSLLLTNSTKAVFLLLKLDVYICKTTSLEMLSRLTISMSATT